MYCLSCGTAVTQGLSYCNNCGARLVGAKGDSVIKSSELKPETLVFFMAALFVFGLGAIIGLMAVMKFVFDQTLIILFTSLSFLIMAAVEGVFIWMLLSRNRRAKEVVDTKPLDEQAAKELDEAKARVLSEPALSVTEHTTRTLEQRDSQHKTE